MMTEERRTIDERYGRATQSDRLVVLEMRTTDVDYIIAAGWCRVGLGTALLRLRCEWDLAAGDVRQAARALAIAEKAARAVKARPKSARQAQDEASAWLRVENARNAALQARALALVHLTTLDEARTKMGGFALMHAINEKFSLSRQTVAKCAGRALQHWIDGSCQACQGRGFHGGHMVPKMICTVCNGSRRTDGALRLECVGMPAKSKASSESAFVLSLLAEMDRKCDVVQRAMLRHLRHRRSDGPRDVATAAAAALRTRLDELRSARAHED